MRVLFIYPNIGLNITINHGIASLSSFIKQYGHHTDLIQFNTKHSLKNLSKIKTFRPHLLAMYVSTTQWEVSKYIAQRIKNKYSIPIFIGGPHPTVSPESIFETELIDGLCIGEGEFVLLELIEKLSKGENIQSINGLWVRQKRKIIKNRIRPLLSDLDNLPFSDWRIFSDEAIYNYPCFSFSRGCPFNCHYCINPALKDIYKDDPKYIRIKSAKRAIAEIKDKKKKYNLKIINFDDDVFIKDKRWLMEFCSLYKDEIGIPFNCNARVENIDAEICSLLKDAGANMVGIGVESGDFYIRERILNRPITDGQIIRAFRIARAAGLNTYAFNMIGIPNETADSFRKTIALNQQLSPDGLQLSIFFPFPGTVLGEECRRKGYIRHKLPLGYFGYSILELVSFPRRQIHRYYDKFEYLVYKKSNLLKALKCRISKFIHRYWVLDLFFRPIFLRYRWLKLKFCRL